MDTMLGHGRIHRIEAMTDEHGCPTMARVLPSTSDTAPTMPLVIPWWLRGTLGNLETGTDVVFAVFEDRTGIIISRADGEGGKQFPWDVRMEDKFTIETHTHTCANGVTSQPNTEGE